MLEREIEQRWSRSYAKEPYKRRLQELAQAWSAVESPRAAEVRFYGQAGYRKSAEFPALAPSSAEVPTKTKAGFLFRFFKQKISRINRRAPKILAGIYIPIPISLQRLLDLLDENGEDDHGMIGPTQFAFKTASEFVLKAEGMVGWDIKSAPVVDSEGGIRITWRNGNRQVKLICPATAKAPIYIYKSSPTRSSVLNENVSIAALAENLSWLLHGDQSDQPST